MSPKERQSSTELQEAPLIVTDQELVAALGRLAQAKVFQDSLFVDSDARCLLQIGRLAESQRRITEIFRNLESDLEAWQSQGRAVIHTCLENDFADANEAISADTDAIAESAFLWTLSAADRARSQLEDLQKKLSIEIEKWGSNIPVEARYANLLEKKRRMRKQYATACIATIAIGVALGYWLSGFAIWLGLIPILPCGILIALWTLNFAMIWESPLGDDTELREWVEKNGKSI